MYRNFTGLGRARWEHLEVQEQLGSYGGVWWHNKNRISLRHFEFVLNHKSIRKKKSTEKRCFSSGLKRSLKLSWKGTACHTPDLGPHWVPTGEFWGHWWKCSCGFTFFIGPSALATTDSLTFILSSSVILKESQKHHFIKFCLELRLQRFLDRLWMSLTDLLDHGGPHGRSLAAQHPGECGRPMAGSPSRAESSCGWRGSEWSSVT